MRGLKKSLVLGGSAALLGLMVTLVPWVSGGEADLEASLGLAALFHLRGPREPPAEVMTVLIDRSTAPDIGLPAEQADVEDWPREVHARLTRRLQAGGAQVIAFDIHFKKARDAPGTEALSQAIREAGNVVLATLLDDLETIRSPHLPPGAGALKETPPVPELTEAAALLAPFPLPRAGNVQLFWLFSPEAGDRLTLPVAALLVYSRPLHPALMGLLTRLRPRFPGASVAIDEVLAAPDLAALAEGLRVLLVEHPMLKEALIRRLRRDGSLAVGGRERLIALVEAFGGPAARYLGFYGPAETIHTLDYPCILDGRCETVPAEALPSLQGKAVFVGFSDRRSMRDDDNMRTVYSGISGVEIGATAFANLLEGRTLRPLPPLWHCLVVLGWAALLGGGLARVSTGLVIPGGLALAAGYTAIAYYAFARHNLWVPLAVPLVQAPLATVGALFWGYLDTRKERDTIHEGIGHYLPAFVVENIIRERGELPMEVHGICLYTDAERYTALSEGLPPRELRELLNRYYEALFEPIGRHGGFVSDVIGDAMLALWATADADPHYRGEACRAALEILKAVEAGRDGADRPYLPTRIGLHCGELVLGNVGAIGRYEYRAVGDVVNTAQRIQDANKRLGTRVLASGALLDGLEGLASRALGRFYLAGKSRPIELYEVLHPGVLAGVDRGRRCLYFHGGLTAFQQQDWVHAGEIFEALIEGYGADGPAHFYLDLCRRYVRIPPEPPWDGAVRL